MSGAGLQKSGPSAMPADPTSLRIFLADDHQMVRDGVRHLVESQPGWSVVGEADNGRDAVSRILDLKPDIAVLDLGMPGLNGLEATRQIKHHAPGIEVLIFTGVMSEDMVLSVFEAGARSFLIKTEDKEHILAALRALSAHKTYFTPEVGEIVFARMLSGRKNTAPDDDSRGRLTAREREIVQLVAEGRSNKDVAETLGISVKTAETHRAAIMRKLELGNLSDLVRYAIRNGIIQP